MHVPHRQSSKQVLSWPCSKPRTCMGKLRLKLGAELGRSLCGSEHVPGGVVGLVLGRGHSGGWQWYPPFRGGTPISGRGISCVVCLTGPPEAGTPLAPWVAVLSSGFSTIRKPSIGRGQDTTHVSSWPGHRL
jgi:hypothetical protein